AQPLGERERAREAEEPRGLIQCRERAGVPPRARRDEEQERERWDEHAPEGEQADLRRDEERDEKRGRRGQTEEEENRPRQTQDTGLHLAHRDPRVRAVEDDEDGATPFTAADKDVPVSEALWLRVREDRPPVRFALAGQEQQLVGRLLFVGRRIFEEGGCPHASPPRGRGAECMQASRLA